ncbi:MAG TPA: hypothetical protein VF092_17865 [Longimicrobium sp.]
MKPIESPPMSPPSSDPVAGKMAVTAEQETEVSPEEIQAFYAAQKEAFAHLRAYHANRPRRKR